MKEHSIVLEIAVVEKDYEKAASLVSAFVTLENVSRAAAITEPTESLKMLESGKCNSLVVNIFSLGVRVGIDLIKATREKFPHVPICLIGTTEQLSLMREVDDYWRTRFDHYYKLPTDLPMDSFFRTAKKIITLLGLYLLSGTAKKRIRSIRSEIYQTGRNTNNDPMAIYSERLDEAFQLAEEALEAKQTAPPDAIIVPGFNAENLQALVKGTIENASSSLDRSARVHKLLLIFGGILVAAAFVVASIKGSWEAVTFGGLGLTGIVASLITNPLKSIASTSRRLVQIQVAYIGFLKVIDTQASLPIQDEKCVESRTKSINEAIRNVLETLEKHAQ